MSPFHRELLQAREANTAFGSRSPEEFEQVTSKPETIGYFRGCIEI